VCRPRTAKRSSIPCYPGRLPRGQPRAKLAATTVPANTGYRLSIRSAPPVRSDGLAMRGVLIPGFGNGALPGERRGGAMCCRDDGLSHLFATGRRCVDRWISERPNYGDLADAPRPRFSYSSKRILARRSRRS